MVKSVSSLKLGMLVLVLALSASAKPADAQTYVRTSQTTRSGPSLAVFNGQIIMSWAGTDNPSHINFASSSDGLNFAFGSKVVWSNTTTGTPALAVFKGKMYVAWQGTDSYHHLNIASSSDGLHYGNQLIISNYNSLGSVNLAATATTLYLAWGGTDSNHTINVATSTDGVNFSLPTPFTVDGMGSPDSPALGFSPVSTNCGTTTWVGFTQYPYGGGAGQQAVINIEPVDGLCRGETLPAGGTGGYAGPSLAGPGFSSGQTAFPAVLVMGWTDQNRKLWLTSYEWQPQGFYNVDDFNTQQGAFANPAVLVYKNVIHFAWQGTDNSLNVGTFQ